MRISDWSSDVCSSDLPPPRGVDLAEPLAVVVDENPPFPCQRLLAPALQYERCLAIERDMPCAPRFCGRAGHGHDAPFEIDVRPVEVEQFTPPRAGVDREEKIGRASCRERVCQYV